MFGGLGIYSEGAFFAVVDDDILYFKVDDATRPEYEAMGSEPFRPNNDEPPSKSYYTVPGDVLEDPERLAAWARQSVAVARAKAAAKKPAAKKPAGTKAAAAKPAAKRTPAAKRATKKLAAKAPKKTTTKRR
jgi:DNA transformation protein and related proteins